MKRWQMGIFVIFTLMFAVGGVAFHGVPSALAAAEKKEGKKMSLRERFALPSHVQMQPMMVPIRHPHQSVSAITLFLEAEIRKEVGAICRQVPRIRDAVLTVLSREPIPTRRGRLVLAGVAEKILDPINRSLVQSKIRSIHVEAGLVALSGSGSGISRLPFATINGCKGIKEIELALVKQQKKKEQEGK